MKKVHLTRWTFFMLFTRFDSYSHRVSSRKNKNGDPHVDILILPAAFLRSLLSKNAAARTSRGENPVSRLKRKGLKQSLRSFLFLCPDRIPTQPKRDLRRTRMEVYADILVLL